MAVSMFYQKWKYSQRKTERQQQQKKKQLTYIQSGIGQNSNTIYI